MYSSVGCGRSQMASGPLLYIAAAPSEPTLVPTLTRPEGVRELIENPPHSRYDGFNLLTLDRATLMAGESLRVSNGDRKHIDLLVDGTLTAVGMFEGFLGWGRHDFVKDPKATPVAVVEFTHDFVPLYERILHAFVEPTPQQ